MKGREGEGVEGREGEGRGEGREKRERRDLACGY